MKIKFRDSTRLGKRDLVAFVKSLPQSWGTEVDSIVVHASDSSALMSSFHRPKKELGFHIPDDYSGSIDDLLDELAITLQVIRDYGHIPKTISRTAIETYLGDWRLLNIKV